MNKIKENILDVLLRKKTDPIYSDMVEDLKNKGYSFEDNPYFVLTFQLFFSVRLDIDVHTYLKLFLYLYVLAFLL